VGGVFLWFFTDRLKSRPVLPLGDPEIRHAVEIAR
jgi:hypothetical protein